MTSPITRRQFLGTSTLAGTALATGLASNFAYAQGNPEFKFKLGTDLPVTHSDRKSVV